MTPNKSHKPLQRKLLLHTKANKEAPLFQLIEEILPELSRNTKKQLLRDRCVVLRGEPTSQFDELVHKGDDIAIYNVGFAKPFKSPSAHVLWQDDYLILLEKKKGIATVANTGSNVTLYKQVASHLKADNPKEKIFLLNRLDRESHGFVLFARSRDVQQQILAEWNKYIVTQTFVAVVEGLFDQPEGELKGTLRAANKNDKSNKPSTRRSRTTYKVLQEGQWASLIEVVLHGRFNGIRSTLNELQHPVIGENSFRSCIKENSGLMLQQTQISILHPITGKKHTFSLPIPQNFKRRVAKPLTRSEEKLIMEQQRALQAKENLKTNKNSRNKKH